MCHDCFCTKYEIPVILFVNFHRVQLALKSKLCTQAPATRASAQSGAARWGGILDSATAQTSGAAGTNGRQRHPDLRARRQVLVWHFCTTSLRAGTDLDVRPVCPSPSIVSSAVPHARPKSALARREEAREQRGNLSAATRRPASAARAASAVFSRSGSGVANQGTEAIGKDGMAAGCLERRRQILCALVCLSLACGPVRSRPFAEFAMPRLLARNLIRF